MTTSSLSYRRREMGPNLNLKGKTYPQLLFKKRHATAFVTMLSSKPFYKMMAVINHKDIEIISGSLCEFISVFSNHY